MKRTDITIGQEVSIKNKGIFKSGNKVEKVQAYTKINTNLEDAVYVTNCKEPILLTELK